MTDPNEQYAYFSVTGDFDPEEISSVVEVQPTEHWKKGDLNPKTQFERQFSRWSLYSRLERHNSLEAHIEDVLVQLELNRSGFLKISAKYTGFLQLVGYFKASYPGFHIEAGVLKRLALFSLAIDFDFYYLYSDSREDS